MYSVPSFSHDFVPNLLRTKVDPEVEGRHHTLEAKASINNYDTASKLVAGHNKVSAGVYLLASRNKTMPEKRGERSPNLKISVKWILVG